MKVRWSASALAALDDAIDFIASDNRSAAQNLAARIQAAARGLRRYPHKGRMVPEYQDPTIRELIVGPFRILYTTRDPACIDILGAVRAERLLPEDGLSP
jgi:plasmid stabilization system protein ParE